MQALLNVASKAATLAGDYIIRASERLDLIKTAEKEKDDYVTHVDQKAEHIIISEIQEAFPDHAILAEESGAQGGHSDVQWIIDPLDGTKNFIHGYPHYAVSIGVEVKGQLEAAAIYDPFKQELFTASRGRGAQLNNKRMRVSERTQLAGSLVGTGFPFKYKDQFGMYMDMFGAVFPKVTDIRRGGSAALDLAYVACGRLDGYFEIGLQAWDMAAGILILREAGGLITDFVGSEKFYQSGNVVAANPRYIKHLLKVIQPIAAKKLAS